MIPVRKYNNQNWLPSIFNDFFDNNWMVKTNATAPAINVIESEKECFDAILDQLASLYSIVPEDETDPSVMSSLQHTITNVILPETRKDSFRPSRLLRSQGSVLPVPEI